MNCAGKNRRLIDWLVFSTNFSNSKSKVTHYNVQKEKDNRTHTTHKTKYLATWIPLKIGGEVRCFRKVSSYCSTCGTRRVLIQIFKEISYLSTMIPRQIAQWRKDNNINGISNVKIVFVCMLCLRIHKSLHDARIYIQCSCHVIMISVFDWKKLLKLLIFNRSIYSI